MLRLATRCSRQARSLAVTCHTRSFAEQPAVAVNWDDLSKKVYSDEGKRELMSLRATYLDIKSKLEADAKDPVPIDFNTWKKEVDPKVVGMFEQAYKSMKVPEFNVAPHVKQVEEQFAPLLKQSEELVSLSQRRIAELQKELKDLETAKERMAQATIDECLANEPEVAKKIDRDIAQGNFIP